MRYYFLIPLSLLFGCAVKTESLYVASGAEVKRTSCGAPYSSHTALLANGVSGTLSARHGNGAVHASVSFSIEEGHSIRLTSPIVLLSTPDQKEPAQIPLGPFRAVLYSKASLARGDAQQYEANQELKGLGRSKGLEVAYGNRDTLQSFGSIPNIRPKEITLQLPALVIDGQPVSSNPVRFVLTEGSYALTCIQ